MMQFESLELSPTADFHVHLRDGSLMRMVVPTIKEGGVDTVYVMPNLQPPITTVAAALSYRDRLQSFAPDVTFLMTLYLNESTTPATIAEAAQAGIVGLKAYPVGVTTNSGAGVLDFRSYYPVFEAMQAHDLVLNLHGELPSTPSPDYLTAGGGDAVTVLNAETMFLPKLHKLHADFPGEQTVARTQIRLNNHTDARRKGLRIVLEHCTTREALDAVRTCGPTVAGSITAHHLWMSVDDWCGDAFNFCKPVAKTPADRVALLRAVVEGGAGKFFFGSDSAPHVLEAKKGGKKAAAGCFTQGWATQLVVGAVEEGIAKGWLHEQVSTEILEEFLSGRGRRFYKLKEKTGSVNVRKILLEKKGAKIPETLRSEDGRIEVVPFRRGEAIWNLTWKP